MDQKGMSPLIATLMLIGFATAIGIVIMNFGRAEVEEGAQCAVGIDLKIPVINKEEQVCFDRAKKQLFFILENGPNIRVEGVTLNLLAEKKTDTFEVPETKMEKIATVLKQVPYNEEEFGALKRIKFTPKIKLYEEELFCAEQAIEFTDIRDCKTKAK